MLVEIEDAPSIGASVTVKIAGVKGSTDAPEPAVLHGEVRHHVAWNSSDGYLSAIGVRFVPEPEEPLHPQGTVLH